MLGTVHHRTTTRFYEDKSKGYWVTSYRTTVSLFPFLPYVSFVEDVEMFRELENPIRVVPVTEAGGVGIRLVNKPHGTYVVPVFCGCFVRV